MASLRKEMYSRTAVVISAMAETIRKVVLKLNFDNNISQLQTQIIDTEKMGVTFFSNGYFENPDGTPITLNTDYLGVSRGDAPKAGPFENVVPGIQEIVVWKGHRKQ